MRAALAVNTVGANPEANLAGMISMANEAADSGADLVVFPEAAVTGLINNDDPAHDLPLGQEIPGPVTTALSYLTRKRSFWLAIGLLERHGSRLFDSAVLLNPDGEIALKYRRNQPQWHGKHADPAVYCQGTVVPKTVTPFGDITILLCGDLFDDAILEKARALQPNYLLFPFARNFSHCCPDRETWEREEVPEYARRAKIVGATTLMVNYLDTEGPNSERTFGGAMVISPGGEVIESLPLMQEGLLIADV